MKSLIIFTILGFTAGRAIPIPRTAIHTRSLEDDFQDFFDLIPVEQFRAIVQDHLANDTKLQAIVAFAMSEDFKETLLALEKIPEYITFLNYLYDSGLDVYYYINRVHNLIGISPLALPSDTKKSRSLSSLVNDIIAILPDEKLQALCHEKLQASPEFKEMYDSVTAPEFMQVVLDLLAVPEYQELKEYLLENSINVDELLRVFHAMISLPFSSVKMEGYAIIAPAPEVTMTDQRSLDDDIEDFFHLIPMDKVHTILQDHLASNTELQAVVTFITSEDFEETLLALEDIPEYMEFIDYLYESGLDVYYYLNWMYDLIDIPELAPPFETMHCRSLSIMVNDVIAILPEEKFKSLCQEKLKTSPEFKKMWDRMTALEFRQITLDLLAVPEYLELKNHLLDNGIDVDEFLWLFCGVISLPCSP